MGKISSYISCLTKYLKTMWLDLFPGGVETQWSMTSTGWGTSGHFVNYRFIDQIFYQDLEGHTSRLKHLRNHSCHLSRGQIADFDQCCFSSVWSDIQTHLKINNFKSPSILSVCLFPGRPSDRQRRKDRQWWPVFLCWRLHRRRDH